MELAIVRRIVDEHAGQRIGGSGFNLDPVFNAITDLTTNKSSGSGGADCVNTGTVDLNAGNKCAEGTSF